MERQSNLQVQQPVTALLPLSPNELTRIKDQETRKARVARLSSVRLAERDLAKERLLKFSAVRRGKEAETIRFLASNAVSDSRRRRPASQLVETHVMVMDQPGSVGSAHVVAQGINAQRTRQQVNRVHSQSRCDWVQARRGKDALVDELAQRATPTIDIALRAAEMDAAKRAANARSIAKARAHTPAPTLVPVDAHATLPSATDFQAAAASESRPSQTTHQPQPGIPVVEYQSTRFHSTLLRDALLHSVDRSEPDVHTVSSSTHALNHSQQLDASTTAKHHLTLDHARRAAARGEAALAQVRAKRIHEQVHAALETARARDWDRRKVQFADYLADRTPAKAPIANQAKLEQAFVNRFPDAAKFMAQELGDIWRDEQRSVSRALNRSHLSHSRSRSRSPSRLASPSPAIRQGTSPPSANPARAAKVHQYPPLQTPPPVPPQRVPPVKPSSKEPIGPQTRNATAPIPARHATTPARPLDSSPTELCRPQSTPNPILPDPLASLEPNPAPLTPISQRPLPRPEATPPVPSMLDASNMADTLSASDSLFAGLSAPSTAPSASSFLRAYSAAVRKSGSHDSNDSGTTWSTWGTATIDDMIDELGSWLSDAV